MAAFRRLVSGRLRPYAVVVLLAVVCSSAATVYFAKPAVTSCTTKTLGAAGDGTAGGVWTAWAFQQEGGLPFHASTDLTGGEPGDGFWKSDWWTQSIPLLTTWGYSNVTNDVCAYNLTMLSGFVLSACAMAVLSYWLTRRRFIAVLAGLAFAFSPFAQIKAGGHVDYVHQEIFPLIILGALMLRERPTRARAVALGAAVAVATYTDGYYVLFGWMTFALLSGVGLVSLFLGADRSNAGPSEADARRTLRRQYLNKTALAGATAFALSLPIAFVYATQKADVVSSLARTSGSLDAYGARLLDYLLPARNNPITDGLFGSWQDRHIGLSNYSEQALSLGWGSLILAVVAVLGFVRLRRRRSRTPDAVDVDGVVDDPRPRRLDSRAVAAVPILGMTALALMIASGPGHWHFFGHRIPGVSLVIYQVLPIWRVYARMFVPVSATVTAMAAIGLAWVFGSVRGPGARVSLVSVSILAVLFQTMASKPFEYGFFDYEAAPSGYKWLHDQPDINLIADYPVYSNEGSPDGQFSTYQPVHGKRVVNPKFGISSSTIIANHLLGLLDPQTIPLLRALGVQAVIVHPGLMPGTPPAQVPSGLRLVRSFSFAEDARTELSTDGARRVRGLEGWYDMNVYTVDPGVTATAAVLPRSGFYPAELTEWRSFQWANAPDPQVAVVSIAGGNETVAVSMDMTSFAVPRHVDLRQNGQVLWSGVVSSNTTVSYVAHPGEIEVRATEAPTIVSDAVTGSTDHRALSIGVSNIIVAR
jgi:hypothetical protein